ncbi:MAG: hypothetical protein GXO64_04820 [Candidatus Micrarchaeota archaeon]|nr:hypothetical protein [Candidatus Micrarchaeota archaeon]
MIVVNSQRIRISTVFILLAIVLISGCTDRSPKKPEINKTIFYKTEYAIVTDVIDGDTIAIENGERVRLLGINTPERGRYLYEDAKNRLTQLVKDKNVTMKTDFDDSDRYGRKLRYIFVNETNVNALLVEEGLATAYIIPPNDRYEAVIMKAEKRAKEMSIGLWNISNHANCFSISDFIYNPDGDDRLVPNNEYVTLINNCSVDIEMNGWTLKDAGTNTYIFKNFTAMPDSAFTIYSGSGEDNATALFFFRKKGRPVWNNDGDELYLRDNGGGLVLFYRYGTSS